MVSTPAESPGQLQIVGGAYPEHCLRPSWAEVFGSGGRAASAAAALGARPQLSCYANTDVEEVLKARAALEGFSLSITRVAGSVRFDYDHGLATPRISGTSTKYPSLAIAGRCVLRFGMLEGDAVVDAEQAVFDPQNAVSPTLFGDNGSRAKRLAVVLNRHEAQLLVGAHLNTSDLAKEVLARSSAEAGVIKQGGRGAFVIERGRSDDVSAYESASVWKIGSGDNFAAHFAVRWMLQGKSAAESAEQASRATAYYCETRGFADDDILTSYVGKPVQPSARYLSGYAPQVYLAGPFFNLPQMWLVDQARNDLRAAGLRVFSPYHDVGLGSAEDVVAADVQGISQSDLLFAIGDGMDPGTLFEIGYARALGKPVIMYCETESEESCKMMQGTNCRLESDYVSAIYRTLWTALTL